MEEINEYYHEELEKALLILYHLEDIEIKYGIQLPPTVRKSARDFTDNFKFRYIKNTEDRTNLKYPLYFHGEEFIKQINKELKNEQMSTFEEQVLEALEEVYDEVHDLATKKGFYHADQINLKVSIEYQENEG